MVRGDDGWWWGGKSEVTYPPTPPDARERMAKSAFALMPLATCGVCAVLADVCDGQTLTVRPD